MKQTKKVIVVGSGNAALCAGISALENGASVLMLEKGDEELAGGNTKYTAGAMRFVYRDKEDLIPLLENPDDSKILRSDFGEYSKSQFENDLLKFNGELPLTREQRLLVDQSYAVVLWLADNGIKFEPIYSRQSFEKEGRYVFWGGLTLAAKNEGVGLFEQELQVFKKLGGEIRYNSPVVGLIRETQKVVGVKIQENENDVIDIYSDSVILGCGGFEANQALRVKYLGEEWQNAKVRGTPHNTGDGLLMAYDSGGKSHGYFEGCHATPMDLYMKDYGNLDLPPKERKNYRKICYFLGLLINADGKRFVDEGQDYRNYTYAQFGREILKQPQQCAFQIFDSKVFDLLYEEYHFQDAHFVEADTIESLILKLSQLNKTQQSQALKTIQEFNDAVDDKVKFDPTVKDGKSAHVLPPKSNWAQKLNQPPFRAYPVTGGITFTYGGLEVSGKGEVLGDNDQPISGLYACGEMVGGVFYYGYPGGSGLTSGAVFGRLAGKWAAS